jgi:hypothetical protein
MSHFIEVNSLWHGSDNSNRNLSSNKQVMGALVSEAPAGVAAAAVEVLAAAAEEVAGDVAGAREAQEVLQVVDNEEQVGYNVSEEQEGEGGGEEASIDQEGVSLNKEQEENKKETQKEGEEKEVTAAYSGCMTVTDILMVDLKQRVGFSWEVHTKLVQTLPLRVMLATTAMAAACQLLADDTDCDKDNMKMDSGKFAVYLKTDNESTASTC